jgi:hypothetical protein
MEPAFGVNECGVVRCAVQEAACSVLETLAAVKPGPTAQEVEKARERFRSKHLCDRVLAACSKAGR